MNKKDRSNCWEPPHHTKCGWTAQVQGETAVKTATVTQRIEERIDIEEDLLERIIKPLRYANPGRRAYWHREPANTPCLCAITVWGSVMCTEVANQHHSHRVITHQKNWTGPFVSACARMAAPSWPESFLVELPGLRSVNVRRRIVSFTEKCWSDQLNSAYLNDVSELFSTSKYISCTLFVRRWRHTTASLIHRNKRAINSEIADHSAWVSRATADIFLRKKWSPSVTSGFFKLADKVAGNWKCGDGQWTEGPLTRFQTLAGML